MANFDTTAYYQPAPGRTDGIPERDQRPRDNGYKSVFTISRLVCQRNRSLIKGLGKNQQKEWTHSLFAVPSVRGQRTVTPWTPRNDCVYTSQAPRWHVSWQHTQKSSDYQWVNFVRVCTASDANWLSVLLRHPWFHYQKCIIIIKKCVFILVQPKCLILSFFKTELPKQFRWILASLSSPGKLGGREVKTSALISRRSWVRITPESPVKFFPTDTRKAPSIQCYTHVGVRAKLNQLFITQCKNFINQQYLCLQFDDLRNCAKVPLCPYVSVV